MNNKTFSEKVFDVFNYLFLTLLTITTVYPIIHVAFASVSNGTKLMAHSGLLLKPLDFNLEAYRAVFRNPMVVKGYLNTIFIIIVGVTDNLLLTSMGAYALSRKNLYFKRYIMILIIFTMYFSGGLIPFYLTVKDIGLIDKIWALILPASISTFNLIIMRTAFEAIPDSLEESAKMDGASDFTVLFKIILPLSKPVIAVMALYYGVSHWNAWFNAMLFIRNRNLYPLQLILREILFLNDSNSMSGGGNMVDFIGISESIKYALIMVATIPILCVYPFLQKYFVKGTLVGAVKG